MEPGLNFSRGGNVQQIIDTLTAQRDGEMLRELEVMLRELVEAVQTTGKKGRIQITLDLATERGGVMLVDDHIKLTKPEPTKDRSTVFFPTKDFSLSRRDPRQPSLLPAERPRVINMQEGVQS
jgi:hypothetical protein